MYCHIHGSLVAVGATRTLGLGCLSEILNETPKGDQSGRGSTFFKTIKETLLKHRQYIYIFHVQP